MASLKNDTGLDDDVLFGKSRVGRLMAGEREVVRVNAHYELILFWETWFDWTEKPNELGDRYVPTNGYVVAEGPIGKQHRFSTLREAIDKMSELQDKYAAQIAAYALGIR
jgi:hypothetical protein